MTTDQPSDDQPSEPGSKDRPMFGPTSEERAQFIREAKESKEKLLQLARDMAAIADDLAV